MLRKNWLRKISDRLSGNQGYRLTEQLTTVPDAEITGTIQNEKQNIIKQYESYLPTNSWSPGSISKSFSSEKDALAYIGYKNLRSFALPQKADSISVNATADKKGNICYISLSELYSCADGQFHRRLPDRRHDFIWHSHRLPVEPERKRTGRTEKNFRKRHRPELRDL